MDFDFTNQDVLFIYGTFAKKIAELEKIKAAPNCPLSKHDINAEISLCSSITEKIRKAYPQLEKIDTFMPKIV